MNKYKFRGTRTGDGERVEGFLCYFMKRSTEDVLAIQRGGFEYTIDPETVERFIIHHVRKEKFPEPHIEFDIFTGDRLYVAGIGDVTAYYNEVECKFLFMEPNGTDHDYQSIVEDIEKVVMK